jgi:phospholipid/cholesterol/gamma-HCH transport system ATP-binding protein
MEAVVEVRDLETRLGPHLIHQGLNLEVRRGEILALVGGSGSGKTTLLREILMLQQPSAGEIRLFGEPLQGLSAERARHLWTRAGVMFQHGALFTSLTVLENVALPLREHTKLSPAVIAALARLKIELAGLPASAAGKYPSELSGGMIKRAAVARALALDPELLCVDEPTSGLDPAGAAAFDELILRLRSLLNLTIVMVTHDVDSLWRATDRVAFLADGRMVETAPVAELARSAHPELQRYFGGPRMQRARAPYE